MATIGLFADVRSRSPTSGCGASSIAAPPWGGPTSGGASSLALELVNDAPLDPAMIGEDVDALRAQVSQDLLTGFDRSRFPNSSLPGLTLAATAYRHSLVAGERVSLARRDALFEDGLDIADDGVLVDIAAAAGVEAPTGGCRDPFERARQAWRGGPHVGMGSPPACAR